MLPMKLPPRTVEFATKVFLAACMRENMHTFQGWDQMSQDEREKSCKIVAATVSEFLRRWV